MEKFPQGEMGFVSKSEVQSYIARNYVPKEQYNKLEKIKIEMANALDYFIDDLLNHAGRNELMRSAIMGGFSKGFILQHIYDDITLYNQVYAELVIRGEIEADED